MRRNLILSLAAIILAGSVAALVWWAPWNPVVSGHLKESIEEFQGARYVPPPQAQSGWALAETLPQSRGSAPTAEQVEEAWQEMVQAANEGKWQAWGYVVDADTGEILLNNDGTTPHTPASTTKILTASYAHDVLDQDATLATGTSLEGSSLYLWGEGDLLLSPGGGDGKSVEGRAGLADLAEQTAKELSLQGITKVSLVYQDALFAGPLRHPSWAAQEVSDFAGDTGPFAVDTGRVAPGEWEFVDSSAAEVAEAFSKLLRDQGVSVTGISSGKTPAGAQQIASVESAPISEQIAFMLHHSDNTLAEQLCKLAAASEGKDTAFGSVGDNLVAHVKTLGVDTQGMVIDDCSGLSSRNKISGEQLVDVLSQEGAVLRSLPRAGIIGTMYSRLAEEPTFGNVQSKTGSLGEVSSLAGIVTSTEGRNLLFAVGTDRVPDQGAYWTKPYIDSFISNLTD